MKNRVLGLTVSPNFGMIDERRRYTIFATQAGEYVCRTNWTDGAGSRHWSERAIDSRKFQLILRDLAELSVPVMPERELVCDGAAYQLDIDGLGGGITLCWDTIPPRGWEELVFLAEKIEELVEEN